MNQQIQSRVMGEQRAALSLRQLLCGMFIWRGVMTCVLPVCGTSAWWTGLLCLLPGAAAAWVFRMEMRMTGASTVTIAVRACLGKVGDAGLSILLAVLLLVEGVSSLTALLTVFTQGVGTKGTQLTLAVLTGVVLLCSLHRAGFPRAVYMLRWGVIALLAIVAVSLAGNAQVSNLFPVQGAGIGVLPLALNGGYSLGWPFVLLLTVPPCGGRGRLSSGIFPAVLALGLVLLTVLTIPHEILVRQNGLAEWLLLPIWYQPNAVRVAGLCLLMLNFFLAVGGAVQLASAYVLAPCRKTAGWLPHILLVVVVLTQTADITTLWVMLRAVEAWLLLPLAAVAVIILPIARFRRRKA